MRTVTENQPPFYTPIQATIEHWHTKGRKEVVLIRVDEDDQEWRVYNDGYDYHDELSYNWNVVGWESLDGVK